jgi:hypothetical protein
LQIINVGVSLKSVQSHIKVPAERIANKLSKLFHTTI